MEFTCEAGGVPAGAYPWAEFLGAEDFNNQFGPGVKLRWRILTGDHTGSEATRICSPNLSPKSILGRLVAGLKGGPVAIGERIRLTDFVGARGSLVVEPTANGGSRVSAFVRASGGQAQAVQQPPTFAGQQPQPAWRPEAPQGPQPPAGPQPPQGPPPPAWGQPEHGTVRI